MGDCDDWAKGHRLHLNEFCGIHSLRVRNALSEYARFCLPETARRRPPDHHPALAAQVAKTYRLGDPGQVLPAAGSREFIRAVVGAYAARPGARRALLFVPTFSRFLQYARAAGLAVTECPFLDSTWMDGEPAEEVQLNAATATLHANAEALAAGCLVYLANPGDPAGGAIWSSAEGRDRLRHLTTKYPASWFLVDEAYVEYLAATGAWRLDSRALRAVSLAAMTGGCPNLLVSKTFSAAYGLAGLRVGYGVVHPDRRPELLPHLSPETLQPFSVHVAVAALRESAHYLDQALQAVARRRHYVKRLRAFGWHCFEGGGNFLLFYAGVAAADTVKSLETQGVHVRSCGHLPDLAGFIQASAGTEGGMIALERALAALQPLLRRHFPTGQIAAPPYMFGTPKMRVAALRQLYWKVAAVLAGGTTFWPEAGTLLGITRHGGIIPWDDGLDFGYLVGEDDPVAWLQVAFAGQGLAVQRNRTDAYWQVFDLPLVDGSTVCASLYPFARRGNLYVCCDPRYAEPDPLSPNADCNTLYSALPDSDGGDELLPLKAASFYGAATHIPRKAEVVLGRALGVGYMVTGRIRAAATPNTAPAGAQPAHRYSYTLVEVPLGPACPPA